MTLFYAIALLALFYLFVIAEFFLPTGGFLGIASVGVLAAAIGIAFSHSMIAGVTLIVFVSATTPMVIFGMLKVWPHTPIGRRMLNRRPGQTLENLPKRTTNRGTVLDDLVGSAGVAKTDLLPSGQVMINGEKFDAVSIGMPIDRGAYVIVHSVDSGRIKVRTADADELSPTTHEPIPQSPKSLEESLESFDIE
ncbi:MAG: NfeD family protein [Planctomycetota bacterium]